MAYLLTFSMFFVLVFIKLVGELHHLERLDKNAYFEIHNSLTFGDKTKKIALANSVYMHRVPT